MRTQYTHSDLFFLLEGQKGKIVAGKLPYMTGEGVGKSLLSPWSGSNSVQIQLEAAILVCKITVKIKIE